MSDQYNSAPTYEHETVAGAESMKSASDAATETIEATAEKGKENIEDITESAVTAGQGAETLNREMIAYSKQSFENAVAATKAVIESKSPYEALQIQTDFAKSAVEAYFSQISKISRIFADITKDAAAPFHERAENAGQNKQATRM